MARLTALFLVAISPAALFGEQQPPAPHPQFRTTPPSAVLDQNPRRGGGVGFADTQELANVPQDAFQPDRPGVTQASLFRNTSYPYGPLVNTPAVGPTVRAESVTADFKLTLPSLTGGLPWTQRGFEPQDADLKLGPFYFKLRAVEAAILHSDNINLTPDNTESGTIAIVGVTIDVLAQITENLRIATSGTFVYLPFEGKGGIAGFGLTDIYDFGLLAGPLARAQVSWDTEIGGWHVVFTDEFQILQGLYSNDFRSDDVLFEGGRFDEGARAGRYELRPSQGAVFRNRGNNDNRVDFRTDLVVYSNVVSVEAERLEPGSILLRARAYHEDLWYNQGNRGQPGLREGASISLISERENMRFKPYFTYEVFRTDQQDDLQHIFRLGIAGPITENLHLLAEAGYYTGGLAGNGMLWRAQLDHTVGPYTKQSLIYARQFNYFHDEVDEGVGYNLQQILGPKLTADTYIFRLRAEEFFNNSDQNSTREEWRAGLRFTYNVGPKTSLRLTGEYANIDPDNTTAWTGRVELGYNFTDTLLLHSVYQYQKSTSSNFGQNYTENLIFLSLTKYFE